MSLDGCIARPNDLTFLAGPSASICARCWGGKSGGAGKSLYASLTAPIRANSEEIAKICFCGS